MARIKLNVADGYIFTAAREIHWEVKTTWLQPRHGGDTKTDAHSVVESIVTSGDLNACLRGPDPSVVRMTMVPTDFQDLLRSSHIYGFVLQFIDAHMGSVANPLQFHELPAQLRSTVELHTSHSFYKLVLTSKTTVFDCLIQVLAFLSGMSLIARVTYAAWLMVDLRTRSYSAVLWTNPFVRCFSGLFCFCIKEEEDEHRPPHLIDLGSSDDAPGSAIRTRKGSTPAGSPLASRGEYREIPQRDTSTSSREA